MRTAAYSFLLVPKPKRGVAHNNKTRRDRLARLLGIVAQVEISLNGKSDLKK